MPAPLAGRLRSSRLRQPVAGSPSSGGSDDTPMGFMEDSQNTNTLNSLPLSPTDGVKHGSRIPIASARKNHPSATLAMPPPPPVTMRPKVMHTPTKPASIDFSLLDPQSPVIQASSSVDALKTQLSVDRLQDILREFKVRHASSPDTQLFALLENTEFYLSASMISMIPFGSKRFLFNTMWIDGCYTHVPEVFKTWLLETLQQYSTDALQSFFVRTVFGLLQIQKDAGSATIMQTSLGYQVFLQILMRHFRHRLRLLDVMSRVVEEYPNFQANPSLAHTLLWVLSQKVVVGDLVIWLEYFFPCFTDTATSSSSSFQSLCLDYMDHFRNSVSESMIWEKQQGKATYLAASHIESLMLLTSSSTSLFRGSQRGRALLPRLESTYKYVKESILNMENSSITTSYPKLFYAMLTHSSSKDTSIRDEALDLAQELLLTDPACILHWRFIHEEKPVETALLLSHLDKNWPDVQGKIKLEDFQHFLRKLLAKNDKLLHQDGWSGSKTQATGNRKEAVSECSQIAQDLYLKLDPLATKKPVLHNQGTGWSGFVFGLLLALFVVVVAGLTFVHFYVADEQLETFYADAKMAISATGKHLTGSANVVRQQALRLAALMNGVAFQHELQSKVEEYSGMAYEYLVRYKEHHSASLEHVSTAVNLAMTQAQEVFHASLSLSLEYLESVYVQLKKETIKLTAVLVKFILKHGYHSYRWLSEEYNAKAKPKIVAAMKRFEQALKEAFQEEDA